MTTFGDLPDHLVIRIFELIERYDIVLDLKLGGTFEDCKKKLNYTLKFFPRLTGLEFDNFYFSVNIFDNPNPQIEYVTFTLSSVRNHELIAFARTCPNIKFLGIYYEFNLNDRSLIEIIKMLPKLESFEIDAAFRFDLRGRFINSFRNLRTLYLDLGQPIIQSLMLRLVENNANSLVSLAMKPVEGRHLRLIGREFKKMEQLKILRLYRKSNYHGKGLVQILENDDLYEGFRSSKEDYDFTALSNLTLLHINAWNQHDYDGLQNLVEKLLSASSKIKDLKIPSRPLDSRQLVDTIVHLCPGLENLVLINFAIDDTDCEKLATLKSLKKLTITGASHSITYTGRQTILSSCPLLHRDNLKSDLPGKFMIW